jgi:glycosyltransferase involved in cell wall biosynthesis
MQVIARLNTAGGSQHVITLSACQDPSRFESLLVCGTENPGEGSMLDEAVSRGARPIVIPEMVAEATLKPRDVTALIKLYRLIRREQPDIVHTHTAKAGFLGRLAAYVAGVPVVIHTYHGHILDGYFGSLMSRALRGMEQVLAALTDCIIAISEQVKGDLVRYGVAPPEKVVVIPIGVEVEPFLNCAMQRGEFRRELALAESDLLIGIVGRIAPIKNHRLFLDAAAQVAVGEPTARFVVVGDGALRPEMERCAKDLGIGHRVIFTGWRRDLPCVYADLDVLVLSSNNEGTPVSAIEAMASGCPVVATCVGGVPDLITDGVTGCLVPPGDTQALATAILRILRDPESAHRTAQTARAVASERYTLKRLLTEMENLYVRLLAETRHTGDAGEAYRSDRAGKL